jgi:hypothetical protein
MARQWEIQAPASQCCRTGEPFADGDTVFSILVEEKEGFRREDYGEVGWEQRGAAFRPVSHWRFEYRTAPASEKPPEPVTRDDAESLLRRMCEESEPATQKARYILALMLERKRLLRQVDSLEREGMTLMVYEHVKSKETFLIEDPHLHLSQIAQVQEEVMALLGAPKEEAPSEPAPAPSADQDDAADAATGAEPETQVEAEAAPEPSAETAETAA